MEDTFLFRLYTILDCGYMSCGWGVVKFWLKISIWPCFQMLMFPKCAVRLGFPLSAYTRRRCSVNTTSGGANYSYHGRSVCQPCWKRHFSSLHQPWTTEWSEGECGSWKVQICVYFTWIYSRVPRFRDMLLTLPYQERLVGIVVDEAHCVSQC